MIGRPIAAILDSLPTLFKEDYHVVMIGRPIAAILDSLPTLSKEDYYIVMIYAYKRNLEESVGFPTSTRRTTNGGI
jgi:hypothetical protein